MRSVVLPVQGESLFLVAIGGQGVERAEWKDGARTGQVVQRDGKPLTRLSGMAISLSGVGLETATLETTAPITEVKAGTVYAAGGVCEIAVRATAKAGSGEFGPRGELEFTVFVESLTPLGDAMSLLRKQQGKAAA